VHTRLLRVLCAVVLLSAAALVPTASAVAETTGAPRQAATQQANPVPREDYRWPVPGFPRVARPFQPPETVYSTGHRGVDLAAPVAGPVLAAGAGTVTFAGVVADRGVVSVQHPDGLRTTYEPVEAQVAVGTVVAAGTVLGLLSPGHDGCPAAACLHWGVRRGPDSYLDPLRLVGVWRVRLLPWQG